MFEPVEEGLKNGLGQGADLVPDDHTGNELLAHSFRGPLSLTTPATEAVIDLSLYATCAHLFG